MKKFQLIISIFLSVAISLLVLGCGRNQQAQIKVDGIQSKAQKVLSGNTVELQNGLKVEILGIKPSVLTKEYLEREVLGKMVIVVSDSKQPQYISTYMTKVRAYLKVKGESLCISGKMLSFRTAELNQTFVHDSINSFKMYAYGGNHPIMSSTELYVYMKPATFRVVCNGGVGTGFFINDNGLAVTNNHVYDGNGSASIQFFDRDGNVNESDSRTIDQMIYTINNDRVDFTIFKVHLSNDEKVRYMPLIAGHEKEGASIAKIGCPVGQPCNFQVGTLSHYNDGFFTHSIQSNHGDSGGPIVNFRGEVIGVNQSIAFNPTLGEQAKGIAYAVDAMVIRQVLDEKGIPYGR